MYSVFPIDPQYENIEEDLRVNIPSGVLSISDGTLGGAPISGANFGIPDNGVMNWIGIPSGIEGNTLTALMNEFPAYTRVNWDITSLGSQFLTAVSKNADDLIYGKTLSNRSLFIYTHPLYEQGTVYEWNFNTSNDISTYPAVSGRLNDSWINIPIVRNEYDFWMSPPTRLEVTTSEFSGNTILDWTQVGVSGLAVLISGEIHLPLFNQVIVEVSGAQYFTFETLEEATLRGVIYIQGHWPHDGFRYRAARSEQIPVYANAPVITTSTYRSITRLEARGIDPAAYVRVRILDFQSKWKSDSLLNSWPPIRDVLEERVFWQLMGHNSAFSGIVQPEYSQVLTASDEVFLAKTVLLTDTIYDQDLEWNILETWKITDPSGIAISGAVDFVPVPNSRYLLILDSEAKAWVVDTWKPAINMTGFSESTSSPIKIVPSWPAGSNEKPSEFTVRLDTRLTSTSDGVQRWQWIAHHHGLSEIIEPGSSPYPYHPNSGWQYGHDDTVVIPGVNFTVSGTGQYIFEMSIVTDNGIRHQTYAGFQQVEKRSLGYLPISGLTTNPSGIQFDSYGRPWVSIGDDAVRLVMRNDVGIWIPEDRVFLTREPYDAVSKNG